MILKNININIVVEIITMASGKRAKEMVLESIKIKLDIITGVSGRTTWNMDKV
jgi:hypothetical protein